MKRDKRPYQDIWRDGRLIERGRRDCSTRYLAIRDALEEHVGYGFTVADIGGRDGYFLVRLYEDLAARGTLIDPRPADLPGHIRHVKAKYKPKQDIGTYDVILLLSVLHHVGDWKAFYESLRARCRWLIVETANPEETFKRERPLEEIDRRLSMDAEGYLCFSRSLKGPYRPTYLVRGGQ
ncbi:MAG: class I SAM-dependent methyltransferase [Myxococcota bacterium]